MTKPPAPSGGEADMDLTRPVHTRISPRAEKLLQKRAQDAGLKPATWVRIQLYKVLGLIKKGA